MTINITPNEKKALDSIDARELDALIDKAVNEERLGEISRLPLCQCGPYVANRLRQFDDALRASAIAKSAKNKEDKRRKAIIAGEKLSTAFYNMKDRMESEERNRELFFIDDIVRIPVNLRDDFNLCISYQFRRSIEDEWVFKSITFRHTVKTRTNFHGNRSHRKMSATERAREHQKILFDEWERLKRTALYTLRDYFEDGGDGHKIPYEFRVRTNPYDGSLNNQSANFSE